MLRMKNIFGISLFVLCYGCYAQRIDNQPCPDYPTVNNFQDCKYQGKWYEFKKYISLNELPSICVIYSVDARDNIVKFTRRRIELMPNTVSVISISPRTDTTELKYFNQTTNANFTMEYNFFQSILPFPLPTKSMNYRILETDYDNYSVSYGCVNTKTGSLSNEFAWAWTRHMFVSQEIKNKIGDVFTRYNITTSGMAHTWKYTCF